MTRYLRELPKPPKTTKVSFDVADDLAVRMAALTQRAKALGLEFMENDALADAYRKLADQIEKKLVAMERRGDRTPEPATAEERREPPAADEAA